MTDAQRHFIKNVKLLLAERDMNARQLCLKIGIQPGAMSRYLSGHTEPTLMVIERIAKHFRTTVSDLTGDRQLNPHHAVRMVGDLLAAMRRGDADDPLVKKLLASRPPPNGEED